MKAHLEFLKVVPLLCFEFFQVMIKVSCPKPKRMKFSIRLEEQCCGGLLVRDTRVPSFPLPHHVDTVWISGEGKGIPTVSRPEVNGCHYEVFV